VSEESADDRRRALERRALQVGGGPFIERLAENLRSEVQRQPPDESGVSFWVGMAMGAVGALVATGDVDPEDAAEVKQRLLAPLLEAGIVEPVHRKAERHAEATGEPGADPNSQ
jgi:hypothetical protein